MLMGWLCSTVGGLRTRVEQSVDINIVGARSVTIRDYGCGIPHDDMMALVTDIMFSYNRIPKTIVGYVPLVTINAFSLRFEVCSFRGGVSRTMKFEQGNLISNTIEDTCKSDGTLISFIPDDALFGSFCLREEYIETMLRDFCCLNAWLTIILNGKKLCYDDGLKVLLQSRIATYANSIIHFRGDDIEIAFTYTDKCNKKFYSFVNGWETKNGGTHLKALKEGVVQAIYEFIPTKNIKLSDIFNGFAGAISIWIEEPVFVEQMRYELGSTTIASYPDSISIDEFVICFVKNRLCDLLKQNSWVRNMILLRIGALSPKC